MLSETFLAFNGFTLNARDAEAVVANAADELAEEERAGWFRQHLEHA